MNITEEARDHLGQLLDRVRLDALRLRQDALQFALLGACDLGYVVGAGKVLGELADVQQQIDTLRRRATR